MQIYGAINEIIVWLRATVHDVFVLYFDAFESVTIMPDHSVRGGFIGFAEFFYKAAGKFSGFSVAPIF
jgi:hypothetical protein